MKILPLECRVHQPVKGHLRSYSVIGTNKCLRVKKWFHCADHLVAYHHCLSIWQTVELCQCVAGFELIHFCIVIWRLEWNYFKRITVKSSESDLTLSVIARKLEKREIIIKERDPTVISLSLSGDRKKIWGRHHFGRGDFRATWSVTFQFKGGFQLSQNQSDSRHPSIETSEKCAMFQSEQSAPRQKSNRRPSDD